MSPILNVVQLLRAQPAHFREVLLEDHALRAQAPDLVSEFSFLGIFVHTPKDVPKKTIVKL